MPAPYSKSARPALANTGKHMPPVTRDTLFTPPTTPRDKAAQTNSVARMIGEAETAAREAKTAKLRQLRLDREADERQKAAEATQSPTTKATRAAKKR